MRADRPAALLCAGLDLVHVDLAVQQGREVGRAGLGGPGHLQEVELQPGVGVAHRTAGSDGPGVHVVTLRL